MPARALTICALTLGLVAPAAAEPVRGVVELFTSQACSSCPPADRLMNAMARDESLVALTCAVDYWDYTGWKDTLALPACSARQKAYAAARGDAHVYTPQAVVGGLGHVAGADGGAIEAALERNRATREGGVRAALRVDNGRIAVTVEGPEAAQPCRVVLIGVWRERTVPIARGENRGLKAAYSNVVRSFVDLGGWSGGARSYEAARGDADFYVVLVQQGESARPGPIVAAARR